jgi:dolichol-phosphate mannosyltransferase
MNYILIPTYNESGNIENLSRELHSYIRDVNSFFVFSDDGSKDDTTGLIERFFGAEKAMVLKSPTNYGPGHAFNEGFMWILARAKDDDLIITMEADCTSDLKILPHMIAISSLGYDLVLASVYSQGGGFEETTFIKKILSSVANLLFRFIFDLKVNTLSSFYRVYGVKKLKEANKTWPSLIEEPGFICMLEILLKLLECKAKTIEVPMVLASSKRVGKSKMKLFKTAVSYLRFLFGYKFAAKKHHEK